LTRHALTRSRLTEKSPIRRPSKSIDKSFFAAQPQLQPALLRWSARSIVSFDRAFDDLGFLSDKFRQMLFYIVCSQLHRLVSTGLVLKDADGRALAFTSIKPIVAHKSLGLFDDGHELLAYSAVDLCTVLRIKVVMANDGEHNSSP